MMDAPYDISAPNAIKITALSEAQNWRCAYCGIRCDGIGNEHNAPSRDHVVPKAAKQDKILYGGLIWENEIMACRLCNNSRGAMYARAYLQAVKWKGREKAAKWALRKRRNRRAVRSHYAADGTAPECGGENC